TEYALLLLSQTFNAPAHQLVNPFYNHSLLKQRIIMLQKNKSQRIVLFKYVLSAPLFGLMLILSSATVNNSKAVAIIHNHAGNLFQKPAITATDSVANNGEIPEQSIRPENADATIATAVNNVNPVTTDREPITEIDTATSKIYDAVETEPSFPGGLQAFYNFLGKTVIYPKEARDNKITGKVFIQFVIEKDGSLSGIKAVRGPEHGLNEAAVSALKLSPKWNAGIQNGKPVKVQYTVPINFTLNADEKTPEQSYTGDKVYSSVNIEPSFPGGLQAFYQYLGKNIRYPAAMREKKIQGKVFVQYVVEVDGSLSNVKAVRGPGYGAEEESVRVISASPKWKPGMQNGKAVRVQYTVPVNFSLIGSKPVGYVGRLAKKNSLTTVLQLHEEGKPLVITGPNNPLYIVDGKEMDDISSINPDHIQSIEVLKDIPAKAYGDKGINGVVLIHSKN
ncbi:MAG TPA: TonB family protein, partial [Mucilaginibacter sp.]